MNEQLASKAFSRQASMFDALNECNQLSQYLRNRFREEVCAHLSPGDRILELNCGTGLDAEFFGMKGHDVLATDQAPGMLLELEKRIARRGLKNVQARMCPFDNLPVLFGKQFEYVISNFGGLNCTGHLDEVLKNAAQLVTPGGKMTLMIMPRFSPWELLMALKGKFRTAFRRLPGKAPAHIEGVHFTCFYYSPGYVARALSPEFTVLSLQGVATLVPPEFFTGFVERFPRLFRRLAAAERRVGKRFPFNRACDHFLITLQKRPG